MAAGGKKGALLKLRKELQRIHKEPPSNIQARSSPEPPPPTPFEQLWSNQNESTRFAFASPNIPLHPEPVPHTCTDCVEQNSRTLTPLSMSPTPPFTPFSPNPKIPKPQTLRREP